MKALCRDYSIYFVVLSSHNNFIKLTVFVCCQSSKDNTINLMLVVSYCGMLSLKNGESQTRTRHKASAIKSHSLSLSLSISLCVSFVYFICSMPKCVWSESERTKEKFHCGNSNERDTTTGDNDDDSTCDNKLLFNMSH